MQNISLGTQQTAGRETRSAEFCAGYGTFPNRLPPEIVSPHPSQVMAFERIDPKMESRTGPVERAIRTVREISESFPRRVPLGTTVWPRSDIPVTGKTPARNCENLMFAFATVADKNELVGTSAVAPKESLMAGNKKTRHIDGFKKCGRESGVFSPDAQGQETQTE
jgi:hypothetical protein